MGKHPDKQLFQKITEKELRVIVLLEEFRCCPESCQWFFDRVFRLRAEAARYIKCEAIQGLREDGHEPDLVLDFVLPSTEILRAFVEVKTRGELDSKQIGKYRNAVDRARETKEFSEVRAVLIASNRWWAKRATKEIVDVFDRVELDELCVRYSEKARELPTGELGRRLEFKRRMIEYVMR